MNNHKVIFVKAPKYGRCLFIVVEYYDLCNSLAFPIEKKWFILNNEYLNWGESMNHKHILMKRKIEKNGTKQVNRGVYFLQ